MALFCVTGCQSASLQVSVVELHPHENGFLHFLTSMFTWFGLSMICNNYRELSNSCGWALVVAFFVLHLTANPLFRPETN